MPEDERRRQQAVAQQRLRAVEVGGDGVQQPRALAQAALERAPTPPPATISGRTSSAPRTR